MPLEFVHYIDDFIKKVDASRHLSSLNIDDYFGKHLSKTLSKKLIDQKISKDNFHIKSHSLVLTSTLSQNEKDNLNLLLEKTNSLLKNVNSSCLIPIKKDEAHFSWLFFGDCNERILTSLSKRMKRFVLTKDKSLDSTCKKNFFFKGLDFFRYKKQEINNKLHSHKKKDKSENLFSNRGMLFLKPDVKNREKILNIHIKLAKILNFQINEAFEPHISIARIKNFNEYHSSLKSEIEIIWEKCEVNLTPDNFILYRNFGTYKNMPVFGLKYKYN